MILPPLGKESDHLKQRSQRILYQGDVVPQVALFNPRVVVRLAQKRWLWPALLPVVTAGGTVALINSGLLKLPEIRRRDVWKLGASGLILISNELEIVRCFGVSAAEKLYYVVLPLLVKSLTLLELMTFGSLFFFVAIHLKINLTLSFVIHVYMLTSKTCIQTHTFFLKRVSFLPFFFLYSSKAFRGCLTVQGRCSVIKHCLVRISADRLVCFKSVFDKPTAYQTGLLTSWNKSINVIIES